MLKVDIIGAATSFGQPKLGVDLGPDALRYANLVEEIKSVDVEVNDKGNIYSDFKVDVPTHSSSEDKVLKNYGQVVNFNEKLAASADESVASGAFPLIIGGDHSLAIGSLAGISPHYNNLGVIWYDAHADLNDINTSPSGNVHGMPLAISCGIGDERLVNLHTPDIKVKPRNIVLIGMRDLDEGEKKYIRDENILMYTMEDIEEKGISTVMTEALEYLHGKTDGIHLSLDVDALDPSETPGTGTPVENGLSLSDTIHAMNLLHESGSVTSMDLVEVNPLLDDRNMTAEKAVAIVAAFFGKEQK
ncbi:arginase [Lacicoccus alkaliphilus]|uniref:Arginase n=1 Tax=Lacicoccus alkaliphilus DSM 16010 TaxID=1123231 RepID=A0A1M7KS04_9BACL|nr:arginase [Salinicoccus alkaliphilus]SHM67803.1 arginase [Salinicoccus alkaliphilus DSM 16010]